MKERETKEWQKISKTDRTKRRIETKGWQKISKTDKTKRRIETKE
jgi:hypothetical protein